MKTNNQKAEGSMSLRCIEREYLKFTPFLVCISFLIFCLCRACGGQAHYVILFIAGGGILWLPYVYISSFAHHFCKWHRALILYDFLVSVMIFLQMWVGFGDARVYLNWVFFAYGMYLVLNIIIKIKSHR